ncbi:MAG TPA: GNAT family protein [Dongiaceae bacterium]|jgi:ribosomal-protein-alanine N-acetyltransferase|nr:GNAT family protein [Dongiaceae bacterium]
MLPLFKSDSLARFRLAGDRTYLRPPDRRDYRAWAAVRDVSRGFLEPWEPSWGEDALERVVYRDRIARIQQEWRLDLGYGFHIFRKEDDRLLGGVNLNNVRRGVAQAANLGYWMGETFANQGYMSDALRALLPHAFHSLGLHRIDAACIPENRPSRHLLAKFGFREIGEAKGYLKINGEWRDHLLTSALLEDVLASPAMQGAKVAIDGDFQRLLDRIV